MASQQETSKDSPPAENNIIKRFLKWWLENEENPNKKFIDIAIFIIIITSITITFFELFNKSALPKKIYSIDNYLTYFFIIEYFCRFYISSNFSRNVKEEGVAFAVIQKLKWIFSPFPLIDLLALLPIIRFLRIFRTLRILRLAKLLRVLRLLRFKRNFSKITIAFRSMKESNSSFVLLFLVTTLVLIIASFGSFISESNQSDSKSFLGHLFYALQLIGVVDDGNNTFLGRFFLTLIMLSNIAFIGLFISLITTSMEQVMEKIKTGKLGQVKLKNHIVICGNSSSTQNVLAEILVNKKDFESDIVIVSESENPEISGAIYFHGDYSDSEVLKNVSIGSARMAIVFAEKYEGETDKHVDMRTVLTVFNIEQENSDVHTIAEIMNQKNAEIIQNKIKGDEIIFKEKIDSSLIVSSMRHPYISSMISELANLDGKVLEEKKLSDLNLVGDVQYVEIKKAMVLKDQVVLGIITVNNEPHLSPKNDFMVTDKDRIILI